VATAPTRAGLRIRPWPVLSRTASCRLEAREDYGRRGFDAGFEQKERFAKLIDAGAGKPLRLARRRWIAPCSP